MSGITLTGFVTKRLADIARETTLKWQEKFGAEFELDPRTPEGQIKSILDERESLIWELAEDVYGAGTVAFSEGLALDNLVALTGQTRDGARPTVVDRGRALGVFGTAIPTGTVISKVGDVTARFQTTGPAVISNAAVNEVQRIVFGATPDEGKFNIDFPEGTTGDIAFDANLATIQAAVDAVLQAGNCTVTGAITAAAGLTLTYGGDLGAQNRAVITISGNTLEASSVAVVVTPSTLTEGTMAFSDDIILEAEVAGPIAVPAGLLTVIETPIVGLEEFTNIEDGIVGRERETDAQLKLRRAQELQIAGAATIEAIRSDILAVANVTAALVFDNDMDVMDSDGRPPHTLDIVVQGGADQDIWNSIFATKAGGIGTIGDELGTVIDSQGFTHSIRFSRPTQVPIYLEIDLVVDPTEFPDDGETDVENAALAYGNALGIGRNIVVFGTSPLSSIFEDIPGILDFTIRISRDAGSPTTDDNIVIEPREVSDWDSSRITVTVP